MRAPVSICRAGLGLAEVEPELRPREAWSDVPAVGCVCRVPVVLCAGRVERVEEVVVGRGVRSRLLVVLFTVRFWRFTLALLTLTLLTLTFLLTFTLLWRGAYTLAGAR